LAGLVVDWGGVLTDPGPDGDHPLVRAVLLARRHQLRTGLLSNADSIGDELAALFDAVVLSGHAGFGKPDPRSYLLVAERLGLSTADCVFVDDLVGNVRAAVATGMVGVHHHDMTTTLAELSVLFGVDLQ
jgi:HAD superfamily hydrolase (TIGR01509 family)